MNIHIFGHSICRRMKVLPINEEDFGLPKNPTFVDVLFEKYNIDERCFYQADCLSEERILYFLKKAPLKIDIAIIFHGFPDHIFAPGLDRDLSPHTNVDFWKKQILNRFKFKQNRMQDKAKENLVELSKEEFKDAFANYKKYFYTHDLAVNRYNGALIQIDQYLTAKKIPAIHCMPSKDKLYMPSWFKFNSGIVDYELSFMQDHSYKFLYSGTISTNHISLKGNTYIFNTLEKYIQQILSQ
jgi:hypothetical protein